MIVKIKYIVSKNKMIMVSYMKIGASN